MLMVSWNYLYGVADPTLLLVTATGMGKWIGIGTAATIASVALVTGMMCFLWRRKKEVKGSGIMHFRNYDFANSITHKSNFVLTVSTGDNESYILELASPKPNRKSAGELETSRKVNGLKLYNLKSIMEATHNFTAENKLGEGGFGQVYKVSSICDIYVIEP